MTSMLKFAAIFLAFPALGLAQTTSDFDPANAILDTSIPFAIGAQEGQQSLRASFGWPTFQEGLVRGVYYRFDPDGYARFSTSPRLDTDVFEVVCRPRTRVCAARKGPLNIRLTANGQPQIQISGLSAGMQLAVSDGQTVIPLPEQVLQPLTPALENLLASARELTIAQNGQTTETVVMDGFEAVISYLRWVAAGQDYSVLPANWPVPQGATQHPGSRLNVSDWRTDVDTSALPETAEPEEAGAFAGQDSTQFQPVVTAPAAAQVMPPDQAGPQAVDLRPVLQALDDIVRRIDSLQRQASVSGTAAQPDPWLARDIQDLRARLVALEGRVGQLETTGRAATATQSAGAQARSQEIAMLREIVANLARAQTGTADPTAVPRQGQTPPSTGVMSAPQTGSAADASARLDPSSAPSRQDIAVAPRVSLLPDGVTVAQPQATAALQPPSEPAQAQRPDDPQTAALAQRMERLEQLIVELARSGGAKPASAGQGGATLPGQAGTPGADAPVAAATAPDVAAVTPGTQAIDGDETAAAAPATPGPQSGVAQGQHDAATVKLEKDLVEAILEELMKGASAEDTAGTEHPVTAGAEPEAGTEAGVSEPSATAPGGYMSLTDYLKTISPQE